MRRTHTDNELAKSAFEILNYETKQVMPIVVEEPHRLVVVTVYVFYFGGKP